MSDPMGVFIRSYLGEDGFSTARACLTPTSDTRVKTILVDPRPVVPIVFLPGIMGTNLKAKDNSSVWRPPNKDNPVAILCAIFFLLGWWLRGPAARQTRMNPLTTRVDNRGAIRSAGSGLRDAEQARDRGWGEVHSDSYHSILCYLEAQLNCPMRLGEIMGDWAGPAEGSDAADKRSPDKPILMTAPSVFGATESGSALTYEEVKHFAENRYPVYAVGYNWLLSNRDSADYVHKRIQNICCQYGEGTKVIVVTHSMGGLVARAITALIEDGSDLIYGVVHAAQPATGAPMAAKRFRTGAEGFLDRVMFGGDDAEWTAVAANSPSALELMPMPDYRGGAPWWRIEDHDGRVVMALPKISSEKEIYTNSAWYGLIPDESLIDPAGIVRKAARAKGEDENLRKIFSEAIEKVADFQNSISGRYHELTHVLYGDGELSEQLLKSEKSERLDSFGTVRWRGRLPEGTTEMDLQDGCLLEDNHRGELKIGLRLGVAALAIQPPDEPGDGTVPASSGASPKAKSGVMQTFKQGGYDHQDCFKHPWARWATLYAIGSIARVIPERYKV